MKHFIPLLFCLLSINSFAQSEAANWYFGFGAGIKFNQANGTVESLNDGLLVTYEGCTSISDDTGNLLFYTDGTYIWNKNHQFMSNGTGILGDSSSTQSAIIVPKPDDPNIYYVFTVGSQFNNTGLHYSIVDMTLNSGLGGVTDRNIRLLSISSEKITAVLKDCISKSMWVVTFASEDGNTETYNTFHAFEVSVSGVNNNSVKSTFPINITDPRGYLKLSPDGTKMASANFTADINNQFTQDKLFLYDFDTATGVVSNAKRLIINGQNNNTYGLEFSPNSQLLYTHSSNAYQGNSFNLDDDPRNHRSTLTQFDLTQPNIQSSQVSIDDGQLYRGGLQLGPDGKIYRALSATYQTGLPYLGVINNPNQVGIGCNYQHNAINLSPNLSSQGLPPFIQSLFNTQIDIIKNGESDINLALCDGDSYQLVSENIPGATYTWTKDNVSLPNKNYNLIVTESGHYEVVINPNNGDCEIEGQAYVLFNPNPIEQNKTLIQCDEDGLKDDMTTFNLNEAYNSTNSNSEPLSYNFFTNPSYSNEIDGTSYKNTSNPQTIYVKVTNVQTGCFSFDELTLTVSLTDVNDTILPTICDDDGNEDGLHVFNLKDADSDILNGIPNTGLEISYYESYEDALLETNKLGDYYTNTQPYSQTIFARVENVNACYGISKVGLVVDKLPNIESQETFYYCLNKYPEYITLDAGLIEGNPNDFSYNWSNGDTSYQTQVNNIDTYTVTVSNKLTGCIKTKTIIVKPSNIAVFNEINIVDVSNNNSITVLVTGEGIYNYALYDEENNLVIPYQESSVFDNVYPGIYNVYVKDVKNNCGIVNDQVSVIGYPKFFTPNNDGVNDTWQVIGISSLFQPNTNITIYDRFGKLIKQLSPLDEGWDGLFNGQKLPTDDYWFSVKLQDGRVFKNHFTLKN